MNTFKFGGFGGVHLHHISFLAQERQSSFFSFFLKFQGTSSSPLNTQPWFSLRKERCYIYLVLTEQRWLITSELMVSLPLLEETRLAGHDVRNASHIHQFHQGEKRGISLSFLYTRTNHCKTLSYTEKFDRF